MTITALLDRSAILLSMICVVHCLALPVAIVILPALSAYWFADEYFHLLALYLVANQRRCLGSWMSASSSVQDDGLGQRGAAVPHRRRTARS